MNTEPRTYFETIGRYVVEQLRIDLTDKDRAELKLVGIDPNDFWTLIWSSECEDFVNGKLAKEEEFNKRLLAKGFKTMYVHRVRDRGEHAPRAIERPCEMF